MAAMGAGASPTAGKTWPFVVVGAGIGFVLGILASIATDVPLAPEAGLVLGALAGWFVRKLGKRSSKDREPGPLEPGSHNGSGEGGI
jgi:hypothetical protein